MDTNSNSLNITGLESNRAYEVSLKDGNDKPISIGIQDLDEAILYYFNNVIMPKVIQNGNSINVPIIYGSPERWKSVQQDGFYRDKMGKIQAPLIMFKRNNIKYNRTVGNKLDGNRANNVMITSKKHSRRNVYDNFYILSRQNPQYEHAVTVIPDYVTVEYSCIIFTNYTQHNNDILESIIFASNSYWGDPKKYIFKTRSESYVTQRENPQNQDTIIRTNFTLILDGYIIPDSINKEIATILNKYYNITKVTVNFNAQQ